MLGTMLTNGVHLASVPELAEEYLADYSAVGTLITANHAPCKRAHCGRHERNRRCQGILLVQSQQSKRR